MNLWEKCSLCELRKDCEATIVLPVVSDKSVFIVKNRPSIEEELLETGFSDREGKLCRKLCDKYLSGLYYCTYLIKCPTRKTYIGTKCIKTCTDNWLLKEIQELKPKAVVALGYNVFDKIESFMERNAGLNFKLFLGEALSKALNSRSAMLNLDFQLKGVKEYVESV